MLDCAYEVDHILALYKGGSNEIDNLMALCRNCHGKKTAKDRLKDLGFKVSKVPIPVRSR